MANIDTILCMPNILISLNTTSVKFVSVMDPFCCYNTFEPCLKTNLQSVFPTWPSGYKTFFMLKSAEHIYPAHKDLFAEEMTGFSEFNQKFHVILAF